MSFGGSVSGMIATIRNNKILLEKKWRHKRLLDPEKGINFHYEKEYKYKKATKEQIFKIYTQLAKERKIRKRKLILAIISTLFVISALLLFFHLVVT